MILHRSSGTNERKNDWFAKEAFLKEENFPSLSSGDAYINLHEEVFVVI